MKYEAVVWCVLTGRLVRGNENEFTCNFVREVLYKNFRMDTINPLDMILLFEHLESYLAA